VKKYRSSAIICSHEELSEGQKLQSENKKFYAQIEKSGEITVRNESGSIIWQSHSLQNQSTKIKGPCCLRCCDGFFQICDASKKIIWKNDEKEAKPEFGPFALIMRNDGALMLKNKFGNCSWIMKQKECFSGINSQLLF